jgi:nicotinamidase-related amidase
MKSIFFLDIDTQRDLILQAGLLHVPGAERLLSKFRRIFDFARKHEIFVFSSVDAHKSDDPEFQELPPHCIRKTEGQRKVGETLFPKPLIFENGPVDRNLLDVVQRNRQVIVEKQSLDIFSNPITEKLLRALPPHAIVFGVPLEHSVRLACLGLRRMGIKTAVINDAVRPLSPREAEPVLAQLREAGVEFIALDTLLGIQEI